MRIDFGRFLATTMTLVAGAAVGFGCSTGNVEANAMMDDDSGLADTSTDEGAGSGAGGSMGGATGTGGLPPDFDTGGVAGMGGEEGGVDTEPDARPPCDGIATWDFSQLGMAEVLCRDGGDCTICVQSFCADATPCAWAVFQNRCQCPPEGFQ
jgi:hypothetical protein